jgi:hypothetical protein
MLNAIRETTADDSIFRLIRTKQTTKEPTHKHFNLIPKIYNTFTKQEFKKIFIYIAFDKSLSIFKYLETNPLLGDMQFRLFITAFKMHYEGILEVSKTSYSGDALLICLRNTFKINYGEDSVESETYKNIYNLMCSLVNKYKNLIEAEKSDQVLSELNENSISFSKDKQVKRIYESESKIVGSRPRIIQAETILPNIIQYLLLNKPTKGQLEDIISVSENTLKEEYPDYFTGDDYDYIIEDENGNIRCYLSEVMKYINDLRKFIKDEIKVDELTTTIPNSNSNMTYHYENVKNGNASIVKLIDERVTPYKLGVDDRLNKLVTDFKLSTLQTKIHKICSLLNGNLKKIILEKLFVKLANLFVKKTFMLFNQHAHLSQQIYLKF